MLAIARYQARRPVLGWDELATLVASDRPVRAILDLAQKVDGVLLPYYIFMHVWTGLVGTGELAMRAPSIGGAVAAAALTGYLGRRLFGPLAGMTAGLLVAVVPQASRYAQEARPYGLTVCFATLSLVLCFVAVDRPTWGRWAVYAIAVALTGLAQIFALLVLIGHGVLVATRARSTLPRWLVAAAAGALPVLPVVWLGLHERGSQMNWLGPPTRLTFLTLPQLIFGAAAAAGLIIGVALTARGLGPGVAPALWTLAIAPTALLLAFSLLVTPAWKERYVLYTIVPWALLAAAALRHTPVRAALVVLLTAAVGIQSQQISRIPYAHIGADFRAVDAILRQYHRPGDVVVYGGETTWAARAGVNHYVAADHRPRDALSVRPARETDSLVDDQCADAVACFGHPDRVWVFRYLNRPDQRVGLGALTAVLERGYREVRRWYWYGTYLIMYDARTSGG